MTNAYYVSDEDIPLGDTPDGWPEGKYVYRDKRRDLLDGEILVADGCQGVYFTDGFCRDCKIIKLP